MKIKHNTNTDTVPVGTLHAPATFTWHERHLMMIRFNPSNPGFNVLADMVHIVDLASGDACVINKSVEVKPITIVGEVVDG